MVYTPFLKYCFLHTICGALVPHISPSPTRGFPPPPSSPPGHPGSYPPPPPLSLGGRPMHHLWGSGFEPRAEDFGVDILGDTARKVSA